jgi:two-component system sensor histidine kinase ChiS
VPWQRSRPAPTVPEPAQSSELYAEPALERPARIEELTLLLCDIRGFTRISEGLSPAETVRFVNAYLDLVCPAIVSAGGVIDKFMGDGVLAFFEGGGNAGRAVVAARELLGAVRRSPEPMRVGVALHTGQVLIGSIGPRRRREVTIISDAVNTLTRLEELNKVYGSSVVASAATVGELDASGRAGFDGPIDVTIRGRGASVSVYVFGASAPLAAKEDLDERLRTFVGRDEDEPTSA